MKIGLYIPCFNAAAHIADTLEGVFKQSIKPDEVVVVDDASIDRTGKIASGFAVRILRHRRNKGLAASRNTAIKNMDADIIASLDADCVPAADWLERLVEVLCSSKKAGAGGKLIETHSSTSPDLWRSLHMRQHWGEERKEPRFLFGSNTAVRRSAIIEAGCYNEAYRNNYEDVDICNRLRKRGQTFVYEPSAVAYHRKTDSVASVLNSHWNWHCAYYQRRNFYASLERFSAKMKYNIYSLASPYLEKDCLEARERLFYLDFMLLLHHSLRDLDYFIKASGTEKTNTLQHFVALHSATKEIITEHFHSKDFKRIVYMDLLSSVIRMDSRHLLGKLLDFIETRPGRRIILRKKYAVRFTLYLQTLQYNLNWWLGALKGHPHALMEKIVSAAHNGRATDLSHG